MYANGEGVPQDDQEAVRWYRLAADQGLAQAQYNLGVMYANGEGVPQDDQEAVRWYRLAADQGLAQAQLNLGQLADIEIRFWESSTWGGSIGDEHVKITGLLKNVSDRRLEDLVMRITWSDGAGNYVIHTESSWALDNRTLGPGEASTFEINQKTIPNMREVSFRLYTDSLLRGKQELTVYITDR